MSAVNSFSYAHSGKARYHVIIDTDGGLDDLRAICMMLSWKDFEVLAITTSNGICSSEAAYAKVSSLLDHFGHQGIPVGLGRSLDVERVGCMEKIGGIKWTNKVIDNGEPVDAVTLIKKTLAAEAEKTYFIALGPLTNLADYLKSSASESPLPEVIWLNESADLDRGSNFGFDRASARYIYEKRGAVTVVTPSATNPVRINEHFLQELEKTGGPYADLVALVHSDEGLEKLKEKEAFHFSDELVPLYLMWPEIFTMNGNGPGLIYSGSPEAAREKATLMLSGNRNMSKAFEFFPSDTSLFAADVRSIIESVIKTYGMEEWRVGVLTQELHGHFGIYSMIGAKMGLRAREYFNIGIDDLEVVSFAGSDPPLSCLNDGLQVSTGATLGHGLIRVSTGTPHTPSATFSFKGATIRITLKEPVWDKVRADIKDIIQRKGALTPAYWEELRTLAIDYWLELDRHQIFLINKEPLAR